MDNVIKELQEEQVYHLEVKDFTAVESGTSVRDTIEKMKADRRTCAVVRKDQKLIGVFTVRDVLQKVATNPDTWDLAIDELMTRNPKTVRDTAPANDALALMDAGRFRNVPVVDHNDVCVGNLTHYDVIKFLSDRFAEDIYNVHPDPNKTDGQRDGA